LSENERIVINKRYSFHNKKGGVRSVLKTLKHCNLTMVDLAENVWVRTEIKSENHAALRSGFAGYPANPRWNSMKLRAWRTGYQLRTALMEGSMMIRSTDSMLIPTTDSENNLDEEIRSSHLFQLSGLTQSLSLGYSVS
jgi:hypothetical protein